MTHNTALGQRGEQVAAEFLAAKGYHILHRNWRCGHREIDLVVTDPQGHLVFVEVKTRSSTEFGMPEAAVTKSKRQHFRQAGEIFLLDHAQYSTLQFDVISVLFRGTQVVEVKHFEADWY